MQATQKYEIALRSDILEFISQVYGWRDAAKASKAARQQKSYKLAIAKIQTAEDMIREKKLRSTLSFWSGQIAGFAGHKQGSHSHEGTHSEMGPQERS